jgi:hypothetical protein
MTEYICLNCYKNFGNKKDHYQRHKNRKNPCKLKENKLIIIPPFELQNTPESSILISNIPICVKIKSNESSDEIKKNDCIYCKKSFSKKFNLDRHLDNRCKEKNKINENKNINENTNININKNINENTNTNININKNINENTNININKNNLDKIDKIDIILKQNEELKKEIEELKKDNKIMKTQFKEKKNKSNININNINIVNNNIINFNDINYNNIDKKLFSIPIMNPKLYGKEIILKMIENININENLPEYQNIVITDKNRGYIKIFNDGKWQTDDIKMINLVINGIIEHSKTIWQELNQLYINNNRARTRLNTSKKYIDLCDTEYLAELEDDLENDDINNKNIINRCKEFQELIFKSTINLFHDNKDIILKSKKI